MAASSSMAASRSSMGAISSMEAMKASKTFVGDISNIEAVEISNIMAEGSIKDRGGSQSVSTAKGGAIVKICVRGRNMSMPSMQRLRRDWLVRVTLLVKL